ncbi:hypothetical protein DPV73_01670 [Leptospira mayottensis]|nr:hypothetical protein DPV73_01670 [Leptospira mayottensis]
MRVCPKTSDYRNLDENLTVVKYARKLVNYQRGVIGGNFYILLRTYRIIVTRVLEQTLIEDKVNLILVLKRFTMAFHSVPDR